jgi:L-lactate permease
VFVVCLFSWRYNPLCLYCHSPVEGFSLVVLILLGQTSGASIGNMVAIHNAVAISATTGAIGSEGKIISAAFFPFLLCSLLMSIVLFVFLSIGFPWVL